MQIESHCVLVEMSFSSAHLVLCRLQKILSFAISVVTFIIGFGFPFTCDSPIFITLYIIEWTVLWKYFRLITNGGITLVGYIVDVETGVLSRVSWVSKVFVVVALPCMSKIMPDSISFICRRRMNGICASLMIGVFSAANCLAISRTHGPQSTSLCWSDVKPYFVVHVVAGWMQCSCH